MITPLSEDQYVDSIRSILLDTFGSEKPELLNTQFNRLFDESLLLFQYLGSPDTEILLALGASVSYLGETGFYITRPEFQPNEANKPRHWFVSFDDVENYEDVVLIDSLDYIFLSPKGSWVIMPSGEIFSILCGKREIIDTVTRNVPETREGAARFLLFHQELKEKHPQSTDVSWVDPLIHNVYSEDKANILMQRYFDE